MSRETYVYDAPSGEVVTKSERARRQEERRVAAGAQPMRFDLPKMVQRGSWVFDRATGEVVPRDEYYARQAAQRHGDGPMLIRDDIGGGVNGLWHPAANRHVDSKSEFRRLTRAHGCEEVGNEQVRGYEPPPMPPVRDTLKAAMAQQGYL
ncbi:hypothetical protein [Azospirillum palustre]